MRRILTIEDNHRQQKVYKYWFAEDELDFCDSISDANKFLETKDYDVILLDLYLGARESGLSFLEELSKRKDVKSKVIVISAYLDFIKELAMKAKNDIVLLTKEEATQERLVEEVKRLSGKM